MAEDRQPYVSLTLRNTKLVFLTVVEKMSGGAWWHRLENKQMLNEPKWEPVHHPLLGRLLPTFFLSVPQGICMSEDVRFHRKDSGKIRNVNTDKTINKFAYVSYTNINQTANIWII